MDLRLTVHGLQLMPLHSPAVVGLLLASVTDFCSLRWRRAAAGGCPTLEVYVQIRATLTSKNYMPFVRTKTYIERSYLFHLSIASRQSTVNIGQSSLSREQVRGESVREENTRSTGWTE